MTDDQFIAAFEDCSLPAEQFHHLDHVRLGWLYLHRYPQLQALARFTEGLKKFAASKGAAAKYHETITYAYLFLIHERIERDESADWDSFVAANPDLLTWAPSILNRYYAPETLSSPRARRLFVLPDLAVDNTKSFVYVSGQIAT